MAPRHEWQRSGSIRPTQKEACWGATEMPATGRRVAVRHAAAASGRFLRLALPSSIGGESSKARHDLQFSPSDRATASRRRRRDGGWTNDLSGPLGPSVAVSGLSHVGMLLASSLQALTFMAEFFSAEPFWLAKNSEARTMHSALGVSHGGLCLSQKSRACKAPKGRR
jgi:hypothetical protein